MKIAELNLPQALKDFYTGSGIPELYPPQAEAIRQGLLDGKNLLAAIPTASGKTLLAEMAMLKSIAEGGKAIYIVPLKALASEKYDRFLEFSKLPIKPDGVKVGIATGDFDSRDEYLGEKDIIVATSEKTDSLLRNGASWLSGLSVVVADEVHLIDSPNRGPTLEVTLAKLRKINVNLQILALSATIGNAKALAKWMDAALVQSEWRPTTLKEGVFYGRAITFKKEKRTVNNAGPDEVNSLVADTLEEGGQCLVFANTRKSSESIAQKVARSLSKKLQPAEKEQLAKLKQDVLRHAETDTCEKLAECVGNGVAFHHAGLKGEHRRIVEDGFRQNILKVIACTPTLAAGLNLPARRVIIRDYKRFDVNYGSVPIPVLEYKQMAGRAGRPRLDPYGEAVLIAKNYDEFGELMENYINADPEHITSKLGTEPAMRAHALSAVATDFCRSRQDLKAFMDTTFFAYQRGDLSHVIDNVLNFLLEENMIIESKGGSLKATDLGSLVSKLYIDPLSAALIAEGLEKAKKRPDVAEFGLLHLICSTPDVKSLYLRRGDYSWIIRYADEHASDFLSDVPDSYGDDVEFEQFLAGVKTAALAEMWINEKSEEAITTFFNIGPGDIRNLMETCTWLMHGTAEISALLGAPATRTARELAIRIENGASRELLDLITLKGVGRVRARKLYDAGYTSRDKLKAAEIPAIAAIPGIGDKLAVSIMSQLGRKVDHTPPETEEQPQVSGQSTLFSFDG
ncbi:ATP-dependent DNA helicase [Methanocella arvoryzae]|uniref:ATP-dependent DNA helicase Hel308 n=1 Tax=Methanocella arvoryzae (strain DSM 22066 / NBRC 105507 / MRE50) TaxID=351160 RepID=HELS_METAR|nr:ATP-dependent DNA helicase [Methanocella arvoryzae]Q0W6L1.1 RecName: Full=ATP-dependent DNA helicase Hel308; AltName: Full=DNA 3'-5' helicase Hel308 [Methanocella arvoryzae MRE50]CAJ35982.1 putative ski2-type helicase [Methanocella arvoryzae MRE50]